MTRSSAVNNRYLNFVQNALFDFIGQWLNGCSTSSKTCLRANAVSDDQPVQSDQGLRCPHSESLDTTECFNGEHMTGRDFAYMPDDVNPYILIVRRHFLAWHGQNIIYHQFKAAHYITKTCLYNFYPLKPQFYIVNLGFTGVYIIFLFLLKNIDSGYSLEPPRRGGSNEYQQSMFWAEIWKKSDFFFIWKFSIFWW